MYIIAGGCFQNSTLEITKDLIPCARIVNSRAVGPCTSFSDSDVSSPGSHKLTLHPGLLDTSSKNTLEY